jgi:membrane fusion protein (multidrug efflux system)
VVSINPGSGSIFSLLPPENATGNWVKVTQRVPVKILLTHLDPHYPLLVGTSAVTRIDTTSP